MGQLRPMPRSITGASPLCSTLADWIGLADQAQEGGEDWMQHVPALSSRTRSTHPTSIPEVNPTGRKVLWRRAVCFNQISPYEPQMGVATQQVGDKVLLDREKLASDVIGHCLFSVGRQEATGENGLGWKDQPSSNMDLSEYS